MENLQHPSSFLLFFISDDTVKNFFKILLTKIKKKIYIRSNYSGTHNPNKFLIRVYV